MINTYQKIICEVHLRDFRTNKIIKIIGKTDIDNLISPRKKNIIIENLIFQNQRWKRNSIKIPKVDIIKISAYKPQLILNCDKGNLVVDQKCIEDSQNQSMNGYNSPKVII